jgi:hypothetical protein
MAGHVIAEEPVTVLGVAEQTVALPETTPVNPLIVALMGATP